MFVPLLCTKQALRILTQNPYLVRTGWCSLGLGFGCPPREGCESKHASHRMLCRIHSCPDSHHPQAGFLPDKRSLVLPANRPTTLQTGGMMAMAMPKSSIFMRRQRVSSDRPATIAHLMRTTSKRGVSRWFRCIKRGRCPKNCQILIQRTKSETEARIAASKLPEE